ncbi:stalk domain-containing protein [Moorella sp. Hama-1]|uniref:stalk domain-containing protein n=1 Tax=Moorella sp. Hama-1 TaxID=2138101 RepID=UPI000D646BB5|nr:stalk domain-containing protein [Moorella sp. Hama-1]
MLKHRISSLVLPIFLLFLFSASAVTPAWALAGRDRARQPLNNAADYLLNKEKAAGILSPWSYMALAVAGRDLKSTQVNQACEKMLAAATQSGEMNDYATLVLAVLAAGGNPYDFQGQNLVKKIQEAQLFSGKFADNILQGGEDLLNAHIWAILALYAAGADIPYKSKALNWLVARQHADGSFYWDATNKDTPDVDSTGMALMALGALGEPNDSPVVQKAVAYLAKVQKENGSFASWGAENPESCHMVIEGLTAVGLDPLQESFNKARGDILTALLRFQLPDGSFAHIAGTGSNEMATYQSLMALTTVFYNQTFFERLKEKSKPFLTSPEPMAAKREACFIVGDRSYTVVSSGKQQVKEMDAAPFIENDRTYVPVRYLAYALGMTDNGISWDEKTATVKLTMGGVTVTLIIGDTNGYINGRAKSIGVAPLLRNGRTYLPARFVAEAFGFQVNWEATSQTVNVIN